jgi:hypothetical protein
VGINQQYSLAPTCSDQYQYSVNQGDYSVMPVVNGVQYEFRTESSPGNSAITGRQSNGSGALLFTQNANNYTTDDELVDWTANFTGTLAVIVTEANCSWTGSSAVLVYRASNGANGKWSGAVNTDWNTAGNWECGTIPTTSVPVIIPGSPLNNPTLGAGQTGNCYSIDIQGNSVLTINTDGGAVLNVAKP